MRGKRDYRHKLLTGNNNNNTISVYNVYTSDHYFYKPLNTVNVIYVVLKEN